MALLANKWADFALIADILDAGSADFSEFLLPELESAFNNGLLLLGAGLRNVLLQQGTFSIAELGAVLEEVALFVLNGAALAGSSRNVVRWAGCERAVLEVDILRAAETNLATVDDAVGAVSTVVFRSAFLILDGAAVASKSLERVSGAAQGSSSA